MDEYGPVVRVIAARNVCRFVDSQAASAPLLEHMHAAAIAWDRIRPDAVGHMALARALFDVLVVENDNPKAQRILC